MMLSTFLEIPPSPTRYEMRDYARQGFEQHRNVTDEVGSNLPAEYGSGKLTALQQHIRYLVSVCSFFTWLSIKVQVGT